MTKETAEQLISELPQSQPAQIDITGDIHSIALEADVFPMTPLSGLDDKGLTKEMLVPLISRWDFLYARINPDTGNLTFFYKEGKDEPELIHNRW